MLCYSLSNQERVSKMVMLPYCLAPHCKSRASISKRHENITFHSFPKANQQKVLVETDDGSKEWMDRRQAWIYILKIKKALAKHSKVCALHFKKEDYFPSRDPVRRNLKKNAVPSQNLSQPPVIQKNKKSTNIEECSNASEIKQPHQECEGFQNGIPNTNSPLDLEAAHALLKLFQVQPDANVAVLRNVLERNTNSTSKCSQSVEIANGVSKICTLYDFLKKDETLEYFTGLSNFDILNTIIQLVQKEYKDEDCQELTTAERIILVLTKMKMNFNFIALSLLFNISVDLCEQYFFQMLKILSTALKPAIFSENQSLGVLKYFEGVCIILDCVEILIQEPTCHCCQVKFYSEYKSHTTVKFMIASSLDGTIIYVSEPFGGKASNRSIFRHCDIISNPEIDAIMVNENFDIDDLCRTRGIELLRPQYPSPRRKQMITKEKLLNFEIASALSKNEKNNEKIKNFRILGQELQWNLVPVVEDIFIVACSVTNLLCGEHSLK